MAFFYPSTWTVVDQDDGVGLVSRPGLAEQMDADQPDIQTGDALLALGVMPAMFIEMMGADIDDLENVMDVLHSNIDAESGDVRGSDRASHSYASRDVVSILFDTTEADAAGLMFVSRESEDVLAFGIAFGERNDLAAYRDELGQVIASMEFTGSMEDFFR